MVILKISTIRSQLYDLGGWNFYQVFEFVEFLTDLTNIHEQKCDLLLGTKI